MSDTVFILGAGASAESGAPVMANFLDVARGLLRRAGELGSRQQFELVFKAIGELGSVFEKGRLDVDNLEAVFAAFEMAKLFRRLGSLSVGEIDALPDAMRTVIVETLERHIEFPIEGSSMESRRIVAPRPYRDFVRLFGRDTKQSDKVAIITFNYDLGIDFALHEAGFVLDYCVAERPFSGQFPLMKLHGSLNWVECGQCGIAPYTLRQFFAKHQFQFLQGDHLHFSIAPSLATDQFEHCNGVLVEPKVPVLVPPTWNKGEHHQRIARVWAHAARHLSEARQVAIIGYSLPASDHFFRLLWSLGTVGRTRIEKLWVVNDGFRTDSDLEARYRSMLGDVAVKRYFPFDQKFSHAIGELGQTFFPEHP